MKKFKVYKITHHKDNNTKKYYIGLTERDLNDRLRSHFNEMIRKCNHNKTMNRYSLQYAMYEEYQKNRSDWNNIKTNLFTIELLSDFDTRKEMSDFENQKIIDNNTFAPKGYNLMNGGGIGGIKGNGITIMFTDSSNNPVARTFRTKLEMYEELSNECKISSSSLRYRTEKIMKNSGVDLGEAVYEAVFEFLDERITGGTNKERQKRTRQKRKEKLAINSHEFITYIKYPDNKGELKLNASEFARLHNRSKSTIVNRTYQFLLKNEFKFNNNIEYLNYGISLMVDKFSSFLLSSHKIEEKIEFLLESGGLISGSLNNLAREFTRDGLSVSTIKSRYRKLKKDDLLTNDDFLYVFGLKEKIKNDTKKVDIPNTISQKRLLEEYKINNELAYTKQVYFVNDICSILDKEGILYDKATVQKKISKCIKHGVENEDLLQVDPVSYTLTELEKLYEIVDLKNKIIKLDKERTNNA